MESVVVIVCHSIVLCHGTGPMDRDESWDGVDGSSMCFRRRPFVPLLMIDLASWGRDRYRSHGFVSFPTWCDGTVSVSTDVHVVLLIHNHRPFVVDLRLGFDLPPQPLVWFFLFLYGYDGDAGQTRIAPVKRGVRPSIVSFQKENRTGGWRFASTRSTRSTRGGASIDTFRRMDRYDSDAIDANEREVSMAEGMVGTVQRNTFERVVWWTRVMAISGLQANVEMQSGVDGNVTGARRGRPKGQPAWNKGKKLDAAHRAKIGQALKDKWKDDGHRQRVSESLRGHEPWNKGKPFDLETREKMRQAKMGTVVTPHVRRKIAQAQLGREVSWDTREKISQALQGMQKSEDHKRKIAATQRKRAAATRVLRAVEGVSRGETADAKTNAAFRNSGKLTSKQKKSKAEILRIYKFQLAEYRALKEELEPWATAFLEKYGRKPKLSDVEDTRISWLIQKFKQYMVLKNNLLTTLPSLRNELGGSAQAQEGTEDKQQRSMEGNRTNEGRWAQAMVAAHGYSEQKKMGQDEEEKKNAGSKAQITTKTLLSATSPRGIQAVNAAIEYRRKRAAELAGKAKTAADAARNIA